MSRLKKGLIGLGLLIVIGLGASLAFVWWIGAWGILFPQRHHETVPPEIAADFGATHRLRVLVYSKTNSFRHAEGIAAAHDLFEALAAERDWAVFHTENSAALSAQTLSHFDVVVFSNATGDHASDAQEHAFHAFLEQGGGWVGLHSAGDGSHAEWTWYADNLVSGAYLGHIMGPQTQEARVVVEAIDHPVTRGLPPEFRHEEEWYSWSRGAREAGFDVLLTVDESSYAPWIRAFGSETDIRMGDHPIVWARCVGRGRAVYTAMGHWGAAYAQDYTRRLLQNAVEWASGEPGEACEASAQGAP